MPVGVVTSSLCGVCKMFAKIENGKANYAVSVATQADVAKCFHPDWLANQGGVSEWSQVPAGTMHGATDNGDGTFTNPTFPTSPVTFRTGKDMALQLIVWLGGGAPGRAGLGAIIKACNASANGADNFFAYYLTLENFTKAEFIAVMNAVDNAIISSQAKAFVAANWPEA